MKLNKQKQTTLSTVGSQAIKFAFIIFCCKPDLAIAYMYLLIRTTEKAHLLFIAHNNAKISSTKMYRYGMPDPI